MPRRIPGALGPNPSRGLVAGVVARFESASTSVRDDADAGVGSVLLLVGAIARAHKRTGEHRAEAERLALLAEPAELVGMNPAVDRDVLGRRLQVLADRDDVYAVGAKLAHRVDDLLVRLAEAGDDARLRQHGV